ncbi:hypothetical protein LCGC14_2683380 [marine sediment metagenome]|uniref:Uncharacterized protein n=1 Tax=marine sediment metagenome TaxID=412755 RepID=A0A0F9CCF5_9ZZZZ
MPRTLEKRFGVKLPKKATVGQARSLAKRQGKSAGLSRSLRDRIGAR